MVSPHLDDAVLSVGQMMAGRGGGVTVATVMTGHPPAVVSTTYDRNSGFRNSGVAMARRAEEDRVALAKLGRTAHLHLGLLDGQYQVPQGREEVAGAIARAVEHTGATEMMGPLGLAHPDHLLVADAFLDVAAAAGIPTWVYEELPARVLWPEQVEPALAGVRARGWDTELAFAGDGPLATKQGAVRAYRSQMWALNIHTLLVPERTWRLTRCG